MKRLVRLCTRSLQTRTPSIPVAEVWKPPHIAQPHSQPDGGQQEVQFPTPVPSLLVLILSQTEAETTQLPFGGLAPCG